MSDELDWLPKLILLQDYPANEYIEVVYQIFKRDFEDSKPKFGNYPVRLKKHPVSKDKSATFWHMVSTGEIESERDIDVRRCERIGWVKPIMEKFDLQNNDTDILWWIEKRGSEQRFHLALKDFSYLVVIANRGEYVLPWTAFYIEYEHQRQKLKKKYESYWNNKKTETA